MCANASPWLTVFQDVWFGGLFVFILYGIYKFLMDV
jgi:hypothetical protein